jgi:hypothetical protein
MSAILKYSIVFDCSMIETYDYCIKLLLLPLLTFQILFLNDNLNNIYGNLNSFFHFVLLFRYL